jgi:hypothetical protein
MLTINQHSLIYLFYCLPSPTIPLKTAQLHSAPNHHLSFSKNAFRTAGSGHKTVTSTRQTTTWHRSKETVMLTMLTTNHHSPTYFYVLPAHTNYSFEDLV